MSINKKTPSFTLFQIKTYWGITFGLYTKIDEKSNIQNIRNILPFKLKYPKIRNIFLILGYKMDLQSLGQEIKLLRKQKNWSQNDMETYSGITKRTISKIENGFIDEVGIKKVETILDLLGVEFALRQKGRPRTLEELQNER
jgi:DNA-binding XRE family transcriptional regulator